MSRTDWTTIRGWHWRLGPLLVSRVPSWAMYPRGPQFWRSGRTLCFRLGTIVVNVL